MEKYLKNFNDFQFRVHDEWVLLFGSHKCLLSATNGSSQGNGRASESGCAQCQTCHHGAHVTKRSQDTATRAASGATTICRDDARICRRRSIVVACVFVDNVRFDGAGSAVEDVEQCPRQSEQVAETVESKVDEFAGQFDHLESEFVLFAVVKAPRLVHQIAQIIFDKHHRRAELLVHILLVLVRKLVVVVTVKLWRK